MDLWRRYLEQYAEHEGQVEDQIIVASCHTVEVFCSLSKILDRDDKVRELVDQRLEVFQENSSDAEIFEDRLLCATLALYTQLHTLGLQYTVGNDEAGALIRQIDRHVQRQSGSGAPVESSAVALKAAFPLLSLMTLVLDPAGKITETIRQVEQRFAAGSSHAASEREQLVNALYRMVEMMQLLVVLSDGDLKNQVNQIASRFQEEDQPVDFGLKLRNGFCRLFELGHLLTTHLDEVLEVD